ncbi:MAG: hypothetical protein ABJA80_16435 [bacterium]
MTSTFRLAAIATVALLAACSSDGVSPTNQPVTLNQAFSELAVPGISAAMSAAGGVSLASASTVPTGCTYSSTTQGFSCPSFTTNGITVTSSYSLLNAAGTSLPQFDAATVAALHIMSTESGTVNSNGDSFTVDGRQDETLSGLQTATHTLNGTSTLNISGTRTSASPTGPFSMQSVTTITNLVPPANAASKYPRSGTVAVGLTSTFGNTSPITSHATVTFNGTSKVLVTVSVGGFSSGCTIDLASSAPTCP